MPTITRKIRLAVVGDDKEIKRVYDYLRGASEATCMAFNECMSALYIAELNKATKEEKKELNRFYSRQTFTKKESGFSDNIIFPEGLALAAYVNRQAQQKFSKAYKDGLMYGKVSLPTFKKDCAIPLHVRFVSLAGDKNCNNGIYHGYADTNELINGLENDVEPKVYLNFPNNITFRICFGNPWKSREQRVTFARIFNREYEIQGSSIQINHKGKIILNLSMNVPKKEIEMTSGKVMGVDLGLAIPAVCAFNDDDYKRLYVGNIDDFLRVRTQLQSQRKRLQKSLKNANGGHGRSKKLASLDKLKSKEENFAETYNHMISRRVVDFAVKNGASQINLEDLSGFGKDENGKSKEDDKTKKVLRYWSYYELQSQIKYKAEMYGIEVKMIDPAYTSQTCSYCGEIGNRETQSKFVCTNPDCKCHKMYGDKGDCFNADFNAARNIAISVKYTDGKKVKKKKSKKTEKEMIA